MNADGCHLGQNDMSILEARKIIRNKIIGITCHNSIKLANTALKNKADYLAFGALLFKNKKSKMKASINLLKRVRKITKIQLLQLGVLIQIIIKNFY